jgi:hypothetical protein
LKAKGHRDGDWFEQLGLPVANLNPDDPTWPLHFQRLEDLLKEFGQEIDRAGLPLPAPAPELFRPGSRTWISGEPEQQALPTLALAQHFGLPTPWLDWSYLPRAAAYFACADLAWNADAGPGSMVVWALRRDFLRWVSGREHNDRVDTVYLTLETAPRAGNSRLHAQAGVFTWLHGEKADERTVDGHVAAVAAQREAFIPERAGVRRPYMRCLRLDRKHAPTLLKLLADEGVTAATAFPDYAGVVQAMKERAWVNACARMRRLGP